MENPIAAKSGQQFPVTTDQQDLDAGIETPERAEEGFEATIIQLDATAVEQLLRKAGL